MSLMCLLVNNKNFLSTEADGKAHQTLLKGNFREHFTSVDWNNPVQILYLILDRIAKGSYPQPV